MRETSRNVLGRDSVLKVYLAHFGFCHVCEGEEEVGGRPRGQGSAGRSLCLREDPATPLQHMHGGRFLPRPKGWMEGACAVSLSSFLLPLASRPMSFPFGLFSG